jgi:hypothetical protein
MAGFFMSYVAVTGFLSNGIKVARHIGKAAARACEGEFREAGNELLTAAVAPLDGVVFQTSLLVCEVLSAVQRSRVEEAAQEARDPMTMLNHHARLTPTR